MGIIWGMGSEDITIKHEMMVKLKSIAVFILLSLSCSVFAQDRKESLAGYIDTKIGVTDTRKSNCVIGPQLPYGSINPSPQTKDGLHDGYHPERPIRGFAQLNVSGTGWGKYGHFLISPQVGLKVGQEEHDSPKSGEITKAYYYQANLDRYGIVAGVSPTHHSALYQFSFPKTDSACVILDAVQSIGDIEPRLKYSFKECKVEVDPLRRQFRASIEATGGWGGGPYRMYFVGEFNKSFIESGVWRDKEISKGTYSIELGDNPKERIGSFVRFSTKKGEKVMLKVAISFSGFENAQKYLASELPNWDIIKVRQSGMAAWESKLQKIRIETPSEDQKKIFYTAFYHTMFQPRDRTGDNPKNWPGSEPYWDDNYAIWDTWRTVYPFLLLVDPQMVRDNINSFSDRLKHNGGVYDGFVAGIEMQREQGGNDVDNVIADAYVKGLTGIDWEEAYRIVKNNADNERKGISIRFTPGHDETFYRENGWIPHGNITSSYTLEYNYNDYCAATIAKGLGKNDDYNRYIERSKGWQALWDSVTVCQGFTGFVGSKTYDGYFVQLDYARHPNTWSTPFYEANSFTYSLFIPHDIDNMIRKMGGKELFAERLEHAFKNNLIAYWNEPAFLAIRLLNHAGRPDLASYWAHYIMKNKYDLTGYPENDDTGGMSSWYLFSAMGFFPNAGQDIYYLNAPLYKKVVLTLENGKTLTISAPEASDKNIYIKACKINGEQWDSPVFHHRDIANGGTIEMELSDVPGEWGTQGQIKKNSIR